MSVVLAAVSSSFGVRIVQAYPIAARDGSASSSCDNRRSLSDIIWSCLLTIFSCTWVAVHPNVPGPDDTWFTINLRHVELMLLAIIAPEAVILWAMRQWVFARKFAKQHEKEHEWTQAHGYFAVMGGFILYQDRKALYTLKPEEDLQRRRIPGRTDERSIEFYLKEGKIKITKKEIKDKSKGDMLSKCLVIVQTGWFVLQCASRLATHLPLIELELVTVAFAVLNVVTYALWWNKPLNVECAVPVFATEPIAEIGIPESDGGIRATSTLRVDIWKALERFVDSLFATGDDSAARKAKRVPTLYAGKLKPHETCIVGFTAALVATIFGAVHCAAWSFDFPTQTEQILWRVSSLCITCLPWPLLAFTLIVGVKRPRSGWLIVALRATGYVGTFIYVVSRVALLVQAFISLRSLPPRAYETVRWTSFIPHV